MKRRLMVALSCGLVLAMSSFVLAYLTQDTEPATEPADSGYQTTRFLAVRNPTSERLQVWVRFYNSAGEKDSPQGPGQAAESPVLFQLPPRKVTFLEHNGAKVQTDRVRIWSESENGRTWPAYQNEDLWLVEKDSTGQRRYRADQIESFTHSFDASKNENTFHERLLEVENATPDELRVEAHAKVKGPDGTPIWRASAALTVRPGQKLSLRGLDGWQLRGSQARVWAQDAAGRLYRWWTHQEEPITLVDAEGYQAGQLGTVRFVFDVPNAEDQPPNQKSDPIFRLPPDQVQVPNVVGVKVDVAETELAKVNLKAIFEGTKPGVENLVTSQEPAAGWRYLIPEVLLKSEATVPNVIGRTYAEAKEELEAAGLLPSTKEVEPKGVVSRQDPVAQTLVKNGSKVELTFEEKSTKIKVPNLVGRTFDEARDELDAVGLKIDAEMTAGRVESQEPMADTPVDRGATVKVVLRVPDGKIAVPDLIGHTYDEARKALDGAKLKIASADGSMKGIVSSQDPPADAPVAEGATVTVVMHEEKAKINVPDVVGKTFNEARQVLEDARLQIGGVDKGQGSRVESQDPAADSQVGEGATVKVIQRIVREQKVRVPDVVGLKSGEARASLESISLAMGGEPASANVTVESQDPRPGTMVKQGATVTLQFSQEETPSVPPVKPPTGLPPLLPTPPMGGDDAGGDGACGDGAGGNGAGGEAPGGGGGEGPGGHGPGGETPGGEGSGGETPGGEGTDGMQPMTPPVVVPF